MSISTNSNIPRKGIRKELWKSKEFYGNLEEILTKIYLLLRPEFLMIGKSKESKEGNSYTETVLKMNLKKELAP